MTNLLQLLYDQNIITIKGQINSNSFRGDKNKDIKDIIINKTKFLDIHSPLPERIYCIKNGITGKVKCKICNINCVKFVTYSEGYRVFCSAKCRGQDNVIKETIKETNIKRYGNICSLQNGKVRKKTKETNINKYGTKIAQSSPIIKGKTKKTNIKRYGVDNIFKSKEFQDKIRKKNKENFGVENVFASNVIKKTIKETNIKKYGVDNIMKHPTLKKKIIEKIKKSKRNNTKYDYYISNIQDKLTYNIPRDLFYQKGYKGPYVFTCKKCKKIINDSFLYHPGSKRFPRCIKCHPFTNGISIAEKEIGAFIQEYTDIIENDRKILEGKELDIYLPDNHLAIEYDGLMFHSVGKSSSSLFNNYETEGDYNNYHLDKTEKSLKKNIQLLHIFENEWEKERSKKIWKSIIKTKIGVEDRLYAKQTYIGLVSIIDTKEFLNINHLHGYISSNLEIGLFDKKSNELLSIMTFGKSRYCNNTVGYKWEMLRYANKLGLSVIGGASKIFKYFLNNYVKPGEQIKVYSDLRFSNGDVYKKLGFELINQIKPDYYYFKTGSLKLESRHKYQKRKLKDKLDNFDSKLTESENMYNNNYRKIYDCGNLVFEYIKT